MDTTLIEDNLDRGIVGKVGAYAFAIYCILLADADPKTKRCIMPTKKMVELSGLARNTVRICIKKLTDSGYIKTEWGRFPPGYDECGIHHEEEYGVFHYEYTILK